MTKLPSSITLNFCLAPSLSTSLSGSPSPSFFFSQVPLVIKIKITSLCHWPQTATPFLPLLFPFWFLTLKKSHISPHCSFISSLKAALWRRCSLRPCKIPFYKRNFLKFRFRSCTFFKKELLILFWILKSAWETWLITH